MSYGSILESKSTRNIIKMISSTTIRYPVSALSDIKNETFVSFLDLSRWLAAAMVFVSHLRNPLFLGYPDIPVSDRVFVVKLWYFVVGLQMEAVVVFFVLSGFLVGGLSCAKIGIGNFHPRAFCIDRVSRLYIAFLPALFLTYFLDITGNYFYGAVGFWDHSHPMIAQKIHSLPFESFVNPETLLGNAFMLQGFVVDTLGSNSPLWTISLEFWFYTVFGLVATAYITSDITRRYLLLGMGVALLVGFLGSTFCLLMGLWLIGVGLAFVPACRRANPVLALIIFIVVLFIARFQHDLFQKSVLLYMIKNYAVAVSFGFLIISMRDQSSRILIHMVKVNNFLASFSYSLYLIHFPLMLFILAVLFKTGLFPGIRLGYVPTSGVGLMLYAVLIIAVYLSAWVFSQITEAQTWRVRRYLKRKF